MTAAYHDQADYALFEAKRPGKNKVVSFSEMLQGQPVRRASNGGMKIEGRV
jgi:hypothetical protein